MPEAPDWYLDIAAQVDMATWARDRVVLVGDAALGDKLPSHLLCN
jgi:2-polyprenyl-6-methoxyphenol hydroxylase-like FAD-dependent oxidoreductase